MSTMPIEENECTNDQVQIAAEPATVVAFEEQGQSVLGILSADRPGNKVIVISEHGQKLELIPARLAELGQLAEDSGDPIVALKNLRTKAVAFITDLEKLWQACSGKEQEFSLSELLQISGLEVNLTNRTGLRLQLLADATFFLRSKQNFVARAPDAIAKRADEKKQRKSEERLHRDLVQSIKAKLLDPEFALNKDIIASLRPLACLAAYNVNLHPTIRKSTLALLRKIKSEVAIELDGPVERQAYSLLHKLGILDAGTNLALIRYDFDLPYPADCLLAAEELARTLPSQVSQSNDLDLSDLHCVTIDDSSTRDMDDALSLEKTATGFRLGIHIVNIAEYISVDSTLERHAAKRASSVYMPDQVVHMFPEVLACDALSLLTNQTRHCLSLLIQVNEQLEITSYELQPSKIVVKEKFDYNYVDRVLHQEQQHTSTLLSDLYQIACTLEEKRLEQGGFKVPKKDAAVRADQSGQLLLEEVDESSPAHSLIGEMMILANQLMAEYAVEQNLPIIFRNQAPPDYKKLELSDSLPPGLAQDYCMRFALKPSQTGLVAKPHSTLGLKAYAQLTSPIRRYGDLCNQRQILTHLRSGNAFYSNDQFYKILEQLDQTQALANKAQRDGKRFWFLRYLQQRKKVNPELWATVLRTDGKLPLLQLDELYMTVLCNLNKSYKAGDRVLLRINRLSPAFGDLDLAEAS